jgi:hypothetical protein
MAESKPLETTDLPQNQPTKGQAKAPAQKSPQPQEGVERVEHTEVVRTGDVRQSSARDKAAERSQARAEQTQRMLERDNWRPTPTQEENDLIAMGLPVDEVGHAPSGAPPDRFQSRTPWQHQTSVPEETREMTPARREGGYQTR